MFKKIQSDYSSKINVNVTCQSHLTFKCILSLNSYLTMNWIHSHGFELLYFTSCYSLYKNTVVSNATLFLSNTEWVYASWPSSRLLDSSSSLECLGGRINRAAVTGRPNPLLDSIGVFCSLQIDSLVVSEVMFGVWAVEAWVRGQEFTDRVVCVGIKALSWEAGNSLGKTFSNGAKGLQSATLPYNNTAAA